ncbi:MAG: cell division protein ZapE [Gammaproteobacteria bacterium]|nr:cell division protein ZapE [Gammaproteobacteria bacterium]
MIKDNALKAYDQMVNQGLLIDNSRQRFILEDLSQRVSGWWPPSIPFFYLWGSVGSGKTTLVNILYECHRGKKQRWHYGDFINHISNDVLKNIISPKDWFVFVKNNFKKRELLCIDEWVIEDIAQLMIWRSLLQSLWKRGVYVVVTSNLDLDKVYLNGLGREHFLPTIEVMKHHAFIYDLIDSVDYRQKEKINFDSPFIRARKDFLENKIAQILSHNPLQLVDDIILCRNEDLLCIDFEKAITPPIWRKDYIRWSSQYQYVLINQVNIKLMNKNLLTNWVRLVDLLYDEGAFVFLTSDFSEVDLESSCLQWPERTKSRVLSWMQRQKIWAQQNLK